METVMSHFLNNHLTPSELERIAYIQGHALLACYAADADDLESQVDSFDDQLDQAKKEGFEAGKREGIGLEATQIIEDLEGDIAQLKANHKRCRANLQAVYEWLRSADCKTVKSRQSFEKRLLAALNVTDRY
jgi:hypothetical protein